jgi:hypothetical protein
MTTDDELRATRQAHTKKFDELCAALASMYGDDTDPAKLSDKRRAEIADEAEELTENWDMASLDNWDLNWDLEGKTKLQRLLAEHHEIGEHILDLQHQQCVEQGLIPDEPDEETDG